MYNGAIVIVDALGTKERWIKNDHTDYIKKYKNLLGDAKIMLNDVAKDAAENAHFVFPYLITVSDTLITIFEGIRELALFHASVWATQLVSQGIVKQIFFRGAVGYGDIIIDREDNIIMGSTINEVGEWYDKGQIIGIYTSVFYTRNLINVTYGRG
jgi:hypothetical protein